MKENGVNISRRHERNDADSRYCLRYFAIIMVQIITKYDIMKKKQIRIDGGIYYDRL